MVARGVHTREPAAGYSRLGAVHQSEIALRDGTGRRRGTVTEPQLSRLLQERPCLRRRDIALAVAPLLAIYTQVEQHLIADRKQVVEAINLRRRVGQSPAAMHHLMESLLVLRVEGDQHCEDRIPRVAAPRQDSKSAYISGEIRFPATSAPPSISCSSIGSAGETAA